MIPAQKSGVIRKAGVPRIPNHFTESNYLDSLPIENVSMVRKGLTKFVREKKNTVGQKNNFCGHILGKRPALPDTDFYELSVKPKFVEIRWILF